MSLRGKLSRGHYKDAGFFLTHCDRSSNKNNFKMNTEFIVHPHEAVDYRMTGFNCKKKVFCSKVQKYLKRNT